ncbi:MAG: ATP-dependent DNA helicase RecG [Gemmatimonadota bacterium]|nr:ATP-dependent DNA helicase RecG [Gemmatimonadota bacterium]MDP7032481.1 ATP-dependent DNA helicase RecG [Gemmatimonadota bacterium]
MIPTQRGTPVPEDSIVRLPGVGPVRAARLKHLGIDTVADLLRHVPRSFEDRGGLRSIASARAQSAGSWVVVRGVISRSTLHRRGRSTLRIQLKDDTGRMEAMWFRAGYLSRELSSGVAVALSGRLSEKGALVHPEFARLKTVDAEVPMRLQGTRPVYPLTEGIGQRLLRELVGHALRDPMPPDPLPEEVRRLAKVVSLAEALHAVHRPQDLADAERGRERLLFDEFFRLEWNLCRRNRARRMLPAPKSDGRGTGAAALVGELPFPLSESQRQAVEEITVDLARTHPMERLLAGEVGSGKTVVALAAICEAASRGWQSALLAPTDLLARQHFRTLETLSPRVAKSSVLLTGSLPAGEARVAREHLATGEARLAVGTHALLSEATRFQKLGLVIVDEQHRFGVRQRQTLQSKGDRPHLLVMSATPIPRTLALLSFGDSDLSMLQPRADASGEVTTRLVPRNKRRAGLRWVHDRMGEGQQAFLVRPRIDGEEEGAEGLFREMAELAGEESVALVHGRVPAGRREQILERFAEGHLRALVATTVIEVGIDVPGASILWVEGADRLGLAQLHQLRGRIARRGQKGYCWLVESESAPAGSRERLETLVEVSDGLRLAEIDLAMRGPGELLGLRQSGHEGLFAGLGPGAGKRIASLAERARVAAEAMLDGLRIPSGEERT